jgi:hypothetical protein
VLLLGVGLAVLVTPLIGFGAWTSYRATARSSEMTEAFLDALHHGDLDAAYARLSPRRRTAMSRAELATFAEHVPFAASTGRHYTRQRTWVTSEDELRPSRACLRGYLETAGGEWGVQIYLVRVGHDDWYVESFGAHAPASLQPTDLLDECADSGHASDVSADLVRRTPPLP